MVPGDGKKTTEGVVCVRVSEHFYSSDETENATELRRDGRDEI